MGWKLWGVKVPRVLLNCQPTSDAINTTFDASQLSKNVWVKPWHPGRFCWGGPEMSLRATRAVLPGGDGTIQAGLVSSNKTSKHVCFHVLFFAFGAPGLKIWHAKSNTSGDVWASFCLFPVLFFYIIFSKVSWGISQILPGVASWTCWWCLGVEGRKTLRTLWKASQCKSCYFF